MDAILANKQMKIGIFTKDILLSNFFLVDTIMVVVSIINFFHFSTTVGCAVLR
jgi:hypothetical protein